MRPVIAAVIAVVLPALASAQTARPATDLDRLMEDVVRRRDDNWQKLQQYILTERQKVAVTGPNGLRVFGAEYDYQWFVKDGFFVRSPLVANGVTVSESERRRYEERFLARQKRRDARKAKRDAEKGVTPAATPAPDAIGDVLRQQSEPNFVSAAYFLRFKFDPGRYALVGRETIDGREVLRIEYYPSKLFADDKETKVEVSNKGVDVQTQPRDSHERQRKRHDDDDDVDDERIEQQMNKVALVTLWVLRDEKQIVKYVFDNVDLGFLPGRSVVRIEQLTASMRMREAFPGIWLPQTIDADVRIGTAYGQAAATYDIGYHDYRQAGVTVRVK